MSNFAHERGLEQARRDPTSNNNTAAAARLPDFGPLVDDLRASFNTGRTRSYAWRAKELGQLRRMLVENEAKIMEAVQGDLRRHPVEAFSGEIGVTVLELDDALEHLQEWMADEPVAHPLILQPGRSKISYQPKGVALIIAPFNFPFYLALVPLIGAISAGCCAVIKPSELTPKSAVVLEQLIHQYMDPSCFRVVQGEVPETTALLKERWDHIFYTGNGTVGRIVMTAAAKYLTPITLELGGKSPVYVSDDCNLEIAAKRLMQSKFMNNGQVCIAPDYILVNAKVRDQFISLAAKALKEFYGDDPSKSSSLTRIVNVRHWDRIKSMLDENHGGKTVAGDINLANRADRFIPPTLILDPSLTSRIMLEEIFGPILPIITVQNMDQAIQIINAREPSLASYIFTENSAAIKKFVDATSSGGTCVNDIAFHIANPNLPFNGVASAGMGGYHGKHSFLTFSNTRSVMERDTWLDNPNRYPPLKEENITMMRKIFIGPLLPPGVKVAAKVALGGALAYALMRPKF